VRPEIPGPGNRFAGAGDQRLLTGGELGLRLKCADDCDAYGDSDNTDNLQPS
jgi:hypothetical protein